MVLRDVYGTLTGLPRPLLKCGLTYSSHPGQQVQPVIGNGRGCIQPKAGWNPGLFTRLSAACAQGANSTGTAWPRHPASQPPEDGGTAWEAAIWP